MRNEKEHIEDYIREDQRTDFIIGLTVAILLILTLVFGIIINFKNKHESFIINQEK